MGRDAVGTPAPRGTEPAHGGSYELTATVSLWPACSSLAEVAAGAATLLHPVPPALLKLKRF